MNRMFAEPAIVPIRNWKRRGMAVLISGLVVGITIFFVPTVYQSLSAAPPAAGATTVGGKSARDFRVQFTDDGEPQLFFGDRLISGQWQGSPIFARFDRKQVEWKFPLFELPSDIAVEEAPWSTGLSRGFAPTQTEFDRQSLRRTQTFAWGRLITQYRVAPGRLDLEVTIENTTDYFMSLGWTTLLTLDLPANVISPNITELTYFGQAIPATHLDTLSSPVVMPLVISKQAIVACTPETNKPLEMRWHVADAAPVAVAKSDDPAAQALADKQAAINSVKPGKQCAVQISGGLGRAVWHDRYLDRTIAPGKQDQFEISLRWGQADDPLAAAADILAAYAKAHPLELDWPDRRPIIRSFFGDEFNPASQFTSEQVKNPPAVKPSTEFRQRMLAKADALIANIKEVNGQGVIIWNIESNGHWLKYVGDPQMIHLFAPEMDAVADEFFGKFKAAGLRTGLCLRPSTITAMNSPPTPHYFEHQYPRDKDVVDVLADKVAYAKKRWGCTMFYVDTNLVDALPTTPEEEAIWPRDTADKFKHYHLLMNAEQWRDLYRRHPDCLFSVEHTYPRYYMASIPYDEMDMGATITPQLIRATWPKAFKSLTADWPVEHRYTQMVQAFANGDIVYFNDGALSPIIQAAQHEAKFFGKPEPTELANAAPADLLAILTNDQAETRSRLLSLRKLIAGQAPIPPAALLPLIKSEDPLLRMESLAAVADHGYMHVDLVPTVLRMAFEWRYAYPFQRDQCFTALRKLGPATVTRLAALRTELDANDHLGAYIIEFLPALDFPESRQTLIAWACDKREGQSVRYSCVGALMSLVAHPEVVEAGLSLLQDEDRLVKAAAVDLVGRSKDERARPKLLALLAEARAAETPDPNLIGAFQRVLPDQFK